MGCGAVAGSTISPDATAAGGAAGCQHRCCPGCSRLGAKLQLQLHSTGQRRAATAVAGVHCAPVVGCASVIGVIPCASRLPRGVPCVAGRFFCLCVVSARCAGAGNACALRMPPTRDAKAWRGLCVCAGRTEGRQPSRRLRGTSTPTRLCKCPTRYASALVSPAAARTVLAGRWPIGCCGWPIACCASFRCLLRLLPLPSAAAALCYNLMPCGRVACVACVCGGGATGVETRALRMLRRLRVGVEDVAAAR